MYGHCQTLCKIRYSRHQYNVRITKLMRFVKVEFENCNLQ